MGEGARAAGDSTFCKPSHFLAPATSKRGDLGRGVFSGIQRLREV